MKNSAVSSLGSEALGTLFFVFLGACAVASVTAVGLGAGLAWALALIVAVWVFSAGGGQFNPWVTVALALRGKLGWSAAIGNIIAQLVGGLVGALLAWWLFSSSLGDQGAGLAATHTAAEGSQLFGALAAEALATFVVVAVVYRFIGSGALYGLGYGLAYGVGVLAIAGITGGSMNFARTFGAELSLTFAGGGLADWGNIWVYLLGPAIGVVLAWVLYPLYGGSETSTSES